MNNPEEALFALKSQNDQLGMTFNVAMKRLQEENARLKRENESFEKEILELREANAKLETTVQELTKDNEEVSKDNEKMNVALIMYSGENLRLKNEVESLKFRNKKYLLTEIKYSDKDRPTLIIGDMPIVFEGTDNKSAELLKKVCTPSHLKQLASREIPIDILWGWLEPSEDWSSLTKKEREKFKGGIYQRFRRINDKAKVILGNKKLFEKAENGFTLNKEVIDKK